MITDSRQLDLAVLRILAEAEPWLLHSDSDTHPLVVSFFIPRHLESRARKFFGESERPAPAAPSISKSSNHLTLVD